MIHLKRLFAHNFKQLEQIELFFPERARVLVQGKNEAGKSTLFEALYFGLFGNALATETGARGLDDLIRYDVEKARVELDVQGLGARLFKIRRSIVRGKTNTWELDVCLGEAVEEIRGNAVVNKRLIAELGFDGDALLNTCFVEQKKLEKLEGLNRAKREESLAKLLNLDALVDIESDLKIRAEDKQEVERLKKRADLAAIQEELPAFENDLAKTESQLKLIDLHGAVSGAIAEAREVQQLDAQIQTLAAKREAAAQRVARIEALKAAMVNVKGARDTVERVADGGREIDRLKSELADARHAADAFPNLQASSRDLHFLAHRLQRIDQISASRDISAQRSSQLAAAQTRLTELMATVALEENTLTEVEDKVAQSEIGAALGDWIAARGQAGAGSENSVEAKQIARDRINQRMRWQVYAFAALLLVLVAAGALIQPLALVFFALAALVVIALAVRVTMLWRDLARVAEELGEAHARAAAGESNLARLQAAEARLTQMNVAIPETTEQAQSRQQEIAREVNAAGKSIDELRLDRDATRERLLRARAVLGELQQQNAIVDATNVERERTKCARNVQKAERILTVWQSRMQTKADALGETLEAGALQRAHFQIDAQIGQLQRRANEATRLGQDILRREQQAQTLWMRANEAYDQARACKPDAAAWSKELSIDAYNAFGKALRGDYDALGGDAVVSQAREIEGDLGRRQGEHATRTQNAALLAARAHELLAELGTKDVPDKLGLKELETVLSRLQTLDLGDEPTLRAQHRDLVGRVHSLRDRQTQLERDLGLVNESLDRAACRAEWEDRTRQMLVRERGVEIVSLARRRIVQKILPATMDYMRRILPTLTRDRYHDAQLDPETYKIQVWDERAGAERGGAFKEKNIFSGGTKDQFSLALRLAFALATLPQERGSAPSFIFLDEPLGSFDDERADALIYLLTEGEIAHAFDQIFLISHVHVNERLFTHRVVLEHGRVAATDLPTG